MIAKRVVYSLFSSHLVVFSPGALTVLTFLSTHEKNLDRKLHKQNLFPPAVVLELGYDFSEQSKTTTDTYLKNLYLN